MNSIARKRKTSISRKTSLAEVGDFWDTHSLADYWDQTRPVRVRVAANLPRHVSLDPEVYRQLAAAAQARGVRTETLANRWLAARLKRAPARQRAGVAAR